MEELEKLHLQGKRKKKMGEVIITLHISKGLVQLSEQPCPVQARTELGLVGPEGCQRDRESDPK